VGEGGGRRFSDRGGRRMPLILRLWGKEVDVDSQIVREKKDATDSQIVREKGCRRFSDCGGRRWTQILRS